MGINGSHLDITSEWRIHQVEKEASLRAGYENAPEIPEC
jgi:hypothetical protein